MILKSIPINPLHDTFNVIGGGGLAVVNIRKKNGMNITIHFRSDPKDPKHLIIFNPLYVPIHKRRQIVRSLSKSGMPSIEIAGLFGVSRSVITSDIKHIELSSVDQEIEDAFKRIDESKL